MAGENQATPCADERAHQTVERDVAAGGKTRLLGRRGARLRRGVARGQDDHVGVEMKVEHLLEREQAIRAAAAETRQERGLRRAFCGARGDDPVRREMDDPVLVKVRAILERGVGETRRR